MANAGNEKKKSSAVAGVMFAVLTVLIVSAVVVLSGDSTPPAGSQPSAPSSASVDLASREASVPLPQSIPEVSVPTAAYDYGAPVPENLPVSNDYFNDAIFLGASRTDLFILRTDLEPAASYAYTGMTVEKVFTEPVVEDGQGGLLTVAQALPQASFSKAYLMFGFNECGWPNKSYFTRLYGDLIDALRAVEPEAVIYVQSVIPVTQSKSDADPLENNTNIAAYNQLLQTLCEEKQVYFVNVAEALVDQNGVLPEEASVDGVHINRTYCGKWYDYLTTHTVDGGVR